MSNKFKTGCSGNPAGRPHGKLNRLTVEARRILNEHSLDVLQSAIDQAKTGDVQAQKLILSLALPRRLRESVAIPDLKSSRDITTALVAVAQSAAEGVGEPEDIRALVAALEAAGRQLSPTNEVQQFFQIVMQAIEVADPESQRRIVQQLSSINVGHVPENPLHLSEDIDGR